MSRWTRKSTFVLLLPLVMSSCTSYDSWNRTTSGMTLGAMFGSTVGGLLGGYRGSDIGTLVGGAAGAAIGAASAQKNEQQRAEAYEQRYNTRQDYYDNSRRDYRDEARSRYDDERRSNYGNGTVDYGRYDSRSDDFASYNGVEVSHLTFSDYNGDRSLQPGERAQISFELRNNTGRTLYNIAPMLTSDYKRINISPTAIIGELPAGRSVRYQAEVVARSNARDRVVAFQIALPDGNGRPHPVKTFNIELIRRR